MKSASNSLSIFVRLALLALIILGLQLQKGALFAQSFGSQAEAAQENAHFQQNLQQKKTQSTAAQALDLPAIRNTPPAIPQLWGPSFADQFQPSQPLQPIPLFLTVLGILLMALWGGILAAAILVTNAGLMTVFLILAIVLSPIFVIGAIFLVGGLIAAFSGGKKKKMKVPTEDPNQ